MAKRNVTEQSQVLMQLPHVADVRNHGHAELAGQQTHREKFTHPGDAHGVHLNESGALACK